MTEYGMLIDMTKFNKILDYDPKNQQITVESGIRWRQIQEFIQKDNLAI
jgi:FAD/FMN-containing dehydrogenase